jgi:hypothetical protein
MTRQARIPRGAVVQQGDNCTVDSRTYVVNISLEQRAQLLAEVGQALRPVLEAMSARIAHLEHENSLLRDNVESIASARPGPVTSLEPPTRGRARQEESLEGAPPCHTGPERAPADVGSDLVSATRCSHPPADTVREATEYGQPSLLEELRHGR